MSSRLARLGPGDPIKWGLALAPPLAVLAPLALAPLASVVIAATLFFHWRRQRAIPALYRGEILLMVAIVLWAGASLLWTISITDSARLWPRILAHVIAGPLFIAAAASLSDKERDDAGRYLVAGLSLATACLIVEGTTNGWLQKIIRFAEGQPDFHFAMTFLNRATAVFALLAWPVAIIFYRRSGIIAGIGFVVGMAVLLSFFNSDKSVLGLVVGSIVFVFACAIRKHAAAVLAVALVISVGVSPLAARLPIQIINLERHPEYFPSTSIGHRLIIWDFVGARIAERPLLGWGLNTSRVIPGGQDELRPYTQYLPLHPHSAPLQWWLELGGVGALLFGLLAGAGTVRLNRSFPDPIARAFALGMISSTMTIASVGYGIWQGWWGAALWIAFASLAVTSRSEASISRPTPA